MISNKEFNKVISKFPKQEKRYDFFTLAESLMKDGNDIQAYILILATWNFARFRYFLKEFNIYRLQVALNKIKKYIRRLEKEKFETINLALYKDNIIFIYNTLSKIPGIEYTGATKIMHLRLPKVFIMWDTYIRGSKERRGNKKKKGYLLSNKIKRFYRALCDKKNNCEFKYPLYKNSGNDYFRFLIDMKKLVKNINYRNSHKSFTKAIDEFNYVNITLPIQRIEKQTRNAKKAKKTEKI